MYGFSTVSSAQTETLLSHLPTEVICKKSGTAVNSISWKWRIPHLSLSYFPQLETRVRQKPPFNSKIAGKLSEKCRKPFSITMAYIRTRLSFRLICSVIASMRGHRCRASQHASASIIFAAELVFLSSPRTIFTSVSPLYMLCADFCFCFSIFVYVFALLYIFSYSLQKNI